MNSALCHWNLCSDRWQDQVTEDCYKHNTKPNAGLGTIWETAINCGSFIFFNELEAANLFYKHRNVHKYPKLWKTLHKPRKIER